MSLQKLDTLVIGAGQAGLAMGYYLKLKTDSFLLIDANRRIGDSWRQRYDSLRLFTPRAYSALPGMAFPGQPGGYPSKDEVANYLESYAHHFHLPVALNIKVEKLERTDQGYLVHTSQGMVVARKWLLQQDLLVSLLFLLYPVNWLKVFFKYILPTIRVRCN